MTSTSEPQRRFPDAREDQENWERQPDTPQTRSPSYRLAFADPDFLTREELRPLRLQLEMLKPEMALAERGIVSTVVMLGSARIPAPRDARRARRGWRRSPATTTRRASSHVSARCGRWRRATART